MVSIYFKASIPSGKSVRLNVEDKNLFTSAQDCLGKLQEIVKILSTGTQDEWHIRGIGFDSKKEYLQWGIMRNGAITKAQAFSRANDTEWSTAPKCPGWYVNDEPSGRVARLHIRNEHNHEMIIFTGFHPYEYEVLGVKLESLLSDFDIEMSIMKYANEL